jgi:hypothetical protein
MTPEIKALQFGLAAVEKAMTCKRPVFRGVQFFDLDADNPLLGSDIIESRELCKTNQERSCFDSAKEFGEVICMGRLVCKPIYTK